jgi:ribosomal protein S18 acetylase RimI-like enzyme
MHPTIRPLTLDDREPLQDHLVRVRAESGRGDDHFTPVTPADQRDPTKLDLDAFVRPLTEPKWRRGFAAVTEDGRIVGYVELKGDELRAGLHRCELGLAVERPFRRLGFGRRLLENAIEFARASNAIDWIDLFVFAHNAGARALYENLGFQEVGTVTDRFRIDSRSMDDVIMTLKVGQSADDCPAA